VASAKNGRKRRETAIGDGLVFLASIRKIRAVLPPATAETS
jgi:hypothetical protein